MNDKEWVRVDATKCSEVDNCFGVLEKDGVKYCRGCGNDQPDEKPKEEVK